MASTVSSLPVTIYANQADMLKAIQYSLPSQPDCPVCGELIADAAPRARHSGAKGEDIYHPPCLEKWIRSKPDAIAPCPYCRTSLNGSVFLTRQERIEQLDAQKGSVWMDGIAATINVLGYLFPLGIMLLTVSGAHSVQTVLEGCKVLGASALGTLNTPEDWADLDLRYMGRPPCLLHIVQDVVQGMGTYWLYSKIKTYVWRTSPSISSSLACLWNAGKRWHALRQEKAQLIAEGHAQ